MRNSNDYNQLGPISYNKILSSFFEGYYKSADHPFKLRILSFFLKITGNKRILVNLKFGFRLMLDQRDLIQREIFYNGVYEPEITKIIKMKGSDISTFIDIGANVGYYTCLMASLNVKNIYSFEPDKLSFQILKSNCRINTFKRDITLYNLALGGKQDSLLFNSSNVANTGISGFNTLIENTTCQYFVDVEKLDNIISDYQITENILVKIDVEGWEYNVIMGGVSFFSTNKNISIILETEVENKVQIKNKEIEYFFTSRGYKIFHLIREDGTNQLFENFYITNYDFSINYVS